MCVREVSGTRGQAPLQESRRDPPRARYSPSPCPLSPHWQALGKHDCRTLTCTLWGRCRPVLGVRKVERLAWDHSWPSNHSAAPPARPSRSSRLAPLTHGALFPVRASRTQGPATRQVLTEPVVNGVGCCQSWWSPRTSLPRTGPRGEEGLGTRGGPDARMCQDSPHGLQTHEHVSPRHRFRKAL